MTNGATERLSVEASSRGPHRPARDAIVRALLESARVIPWEADPRTWRLTYVGLTAADLFGYPLDQWLEPEFWADHIHPDDRDAVLHRCRAACAAGRDDELEYRMVAAGGAPVWLRHLVAGSHAGSGTAVCGLFIDVTEARHVRHRLEEEKRLLDCVIENLPGAFFMVDRCGRLVRWNRNRERILGYSSGESGTMRAQDTVAAEDRERVSLTCRQTFRDGTGSSEHHVVTKDGRKIPVLSHAAVVTLGNEPFMLGMAMDISPLKQAEAELRRALAEVQELKGRLELENAYLRQEIELHHPHDEIVGESEAIKRVLGQVEQVAATGTTVLLLGETGVGKELIARALHRLSPRQHRPLVKVNCAALPSMLVESELFGRERGAYTGALTRQVGRFEVADRSTIFLDEVGELPLELQAKLLRVLQDREFERLGSVKTIKVDVRVIAATNRDLAKEVSAGRFREDLFYRLNVFPIHVPALRERPEDIPLLVWAFVREFETTMGKRIETISRKSMDALVRYPWPGNVRELRNVVERAMIVTRGVTLNVAPPATAAPPTSQESFALEDVERAHVLAVLERTRWRIRGAGGAAAVLGLKPTTLEARLAKLGLRRPESGAARRPVSSSRA